MSFGSEHKTFLSHGLVVSGANFNDTPTDQRLPDLGRNQKMMLSSCHLHIVFICFVPNTGKRVIILGVWLVMHGRQDSTTPGHGIIKY